MISKVSQSDWGGGLWRSGNRDRVPENASGELQELLLGEDGLPFERGGATRKSNAAVGTGLLWVADAVLAGGQRTAFQGATDNKLYALAANDATPTQIWNLTTAATNIFRPPVLNGAIQLAATGTGTKWWAGSRKTAAYGTGVVTVQAGSRTVTGVGTAWLANADAGMFFFGATSLSKAAFVPVKSVDSDTQLTLALPWPQDALTGSSYSMGPSTNSATFLQGDGGTTTPPDVPPLTAIQAAVAGRLVWATDTVVNFTKAGVFDWADANDYHTFPSTIVGLAPLRDTLMVFTASGVYAVSNMAYNLASTAGDPQQRVELVNADLIAWGHEGIASWSGALVVPARDGIWLIDSVSSPQKISLPIDDLYLSYVNAGYKPGVAEVFNGHYFLPILNASNVWQDTLVCRLTQTRSGPPFAWSRLRGADAQVAGYAERSGTPLLLGASLLSSSRVLDCTSYFAPAAGVKADSDASTRQAVWESREFALSDMPTTVRRVRVWYELTNPGSGTPTVEFAYAKDSDTGYTVVSNSLGTYQGTGIIAGWENDGTLYNQWPVNKRARGMRFRLRTTGDNAGFKIRQVELVTEQVQNQ